MNKMTENFNSEKSIGDIIAEAQKLTPDQINQILALQRSKGLKFGEAAVELGFVKREDVLWALSQQYHYPYAAEGRDSISAELVVATNPFDAGAEFFRDVRSQLLSGPFGRRSAPLALAICSTDVGDGKSFFSSNLAAAFSQLDGRTLLLDADMRTPRLHEIFNIGNTQSGLSSVLAGRAESNVIRPIEALPSLFVMPVGVIPPNPLELVQRASFDMLLSELVMKFDYVIVDTPAAVHGADARVVAAKCGAAVALARRGVTKTAALNTLVAQLQKACPAFAGTILNEFNRTS
jgi:protein-tyrosine kinase